MIPRLSRRHRGDHFRVKFGPQMEVEDQDLEVVEMDELDDEVPFEFTLPRGRVAAFAEEEGHEDASLSGTFGSGGQEGPAQVCASGLPGGDDPGVWAYLFRVLGLLHNSILMLYPYIKVWRYNDGVNNANINW